MLACCASQLGHGPNGVREGRWLGMQVNPHCALLVFFVLFNSTLFVYYLIPADSNIGTRSSFKTNNRLIHPANESLINV